MKFIKTAIMLVAAIVLLMIDYACLLVIIPIEYVYPRLLGIRLAILRKMFNTNGYDGDKLALYGLNTAVSYVNDSGKEFVNAIIRFGRFRR